VNAAARNGSLAGTVRSALRLLLVTDGRGDERSLERLVREAIGAGVRAVQLREPELGARRLAALCDRLRPLLEEREGLLFVNDRVDVAAAGHAHGVQVGHRSLPVAAARALLRQGQLLGVSVHDPGELQDAVAGGADFVLLAPVLPTSSKPGAPNLGLLKAAALTVESPVPVLWLGGIDATAAARLHDLQPDERPLGVAVRSAIGSSGAPAAAVRAILAALPAP
jgi:thiamine-phosphate pyrophosphorylase